jgi:VIT1/CCC1 family predicted Fe2+/Mn2+ transporter
VGRIILNSGNFGYNWHSKKVRNMANQYSVLYYAVSALLGIIIMFNTPTIPEVQRYFWTSLIISIILIGVVFVHLNNRIDSLNR